MHHTMTKPKELILKVRIVVNKNAPWKSNYIEDNSTLRLQFTTIHPLRVNSTNWAVSLSQLCATYLNIGSPMLSNVRTWGRMQYFFKSCLAKRPPVWVQSASWGCIDAWSPNAIEMQCYATTTMHWCTSLMDRHFFPKKVFCQSFDDGYLASHRWSTYITSVNKAFLP